ncbi:HAD family hydrolase [Deinococcus rhizophilus]|uniref:HAD family hydrolase n=1 Tax=Deinococcus rhizophilus TaxID=3049544 RepID=UPI002554B1ED|nr:HAD family hydrolase [Deinococcus rhizophilus]
MQQEVSARPGTRSTGKFNPNELARWLGDQGFQAPGLVGDVGLLFLDEYAEPGTLSLRRAEVVGSVSDRRTAPPPTPAGPVAPPRSTAVPPEPVPPSAPALPFDLLIFDCDDTLVYTAPLEAHRKGNRPCQGPEWEAALRHTFVAPGLREWLRTLRDTPGAPRLVVFSQARRPYLQALLRHHFPDVAFDAVLGHEDAVQARGAFKPDPTLANRLLREYAVQAARTAVIGDHRKDVHLAHALGATAVLAGFYVERKIGDWSYRNALEDVPHLVVHAAAELPQALLHPRRGDLPLEALYEGVAPGDLTRSSARSRYRPYDHARKTSSRLTVTSLGRYYKQGRDSKHHDLPVARHHRLSQDVLAKERDQADPPSEWVTGVAWALRQLTTAAPHGRWVVTIVPAKAGRPRRMEALLQKVEADLGNAAPRLSFAPEVFCFTAAARSNKDLPTAEERAENLAGGLILHPGYTPRPDHAYVILDDVFTTGATLIRARDLLVTAHVPERLIQGLTVTKTVSVRKSQVHA